MVVDVNKTVQTLPIDVFIEYNKVKQKVATGEIVDDIFRSLTTIEIQLLNDGVYIIQDYLHVRKHIIRVEINYCDEKGRIEISILTLDNDTLGYKTIMKEELTTSDKKVKALVKRIVRRYISSL